MTRPDPQLGHRGGAALIPISEADVPLHAIPDDGAFALAVITGVEGPSYRPVGAVMAVDADGRMTGNLSSGCIDRDVALQAVQALEDGRARHLRYGVGSPFRDLELPCGGGLDIAVLPRPDPVRLGRARDLLAGREHAVLELGPVTLDIHPGLRFLVFGKGPEASCFAALARSAGYQVELFAPDDDTLHGPARGERLRTPEWPADLAVDARTAVTIFFHDHDWEPVLLAAALRSQAFFVGAQGSLRAHRARCAALSDLGVAEELIARLASPFGLIPSARDPRTLAVSVLAQAVEQARLP
ncbi:xanthine dehydrogenase accessory factor [Paracoccus isoporae]|uniref:Xanthine dehydrogenase accessory factor n=1 Tax=Paracoccus isoporae TaxID=591205 RepID=A0A1G7E972_9RHOB|nr:XdhC family protein [Paracoccus isoporae]SDE60248.1 xanthine dehydrogenase accessory factor [Paracoccus isoporae]